MKGFNVPAFMNIIDIAPQYSGTVTGIVNGFSAIAGVLVPPLTAMVLDDDPHDPARWRIIFNSGVFFYCAAFFAFCFFGKFDPEPFNNMRKNQENP